MSTLQTIIFVVVAIAAVGLALLMIHDVFNTVDQTRRRTDMAAEASRRMQQQRKS